ncbi:hypothetical protein RY27_18440 [Litorilinea aerophila]|nr:hypothetical protein RY27_18440 [Litorilinea aerophila]GIV76817.1 MAG: hypothetical protein KatS3mg050_1211 [Litorilinea sp.]
MGWQLTALGVLLAVGGLYLLAWLRLRKRLPGHGRVSFARGERLAAWSAGVLLLLTALASPMQAWSPYLLTARTFQMVLLYMLVPPLLWLACPFHVILRGMPFAVRRPLVSWLRRGRRSRWFRLVVHPATAWFAFLSGMLLWHDPRLTNWVLDREMARLLEPWLLLGVALFFWRHVTNTGPRIRRACPGWGSVAAILGVEIPNMVAGVTIAFSSAPLYSHYVQVRAAWPAQVQPPLPLGLMEDQMLSGALVWVVGSLVYISTIVLLLNRLFAQDGSTGPQHLLHWDAHDKLVAPGLEYRARQNILRNVDLDHH